ncbi:pirin family protein [Hymenobacter sublimis]|uniref:Quercetin 2,3-dioxygenase C-terminal cupin domain-containing protein n=1 Tax=Hymenobacter sublimis TaxID=2933777 RepID=A0ABY4J5Z0_9BACT|nr:hypothetical protein [Hymenobacter sublimis]UPL48178.1 hypothetical protein MWH26_13385 [Hymenobacter sublimis]
MSKHTPGRIYLADQHGQLRTPQSSRTSVLSFDGFTDEQRPAAGHLLAFNEETLAGGQHVVLPAPEAAYLILLPLTGEICLAGSSSEAKCAQVEEVVVSWLPAGATLHLTNPYDAEPVSFLHIWVAAGQQTSRTAAVFPYTFEQLENALVEVVPRAAELPQPLGLPFSLSLGRFAGRQEALYCPAQTGTLVFAYVLAGAFEAEGRLLHAKDGLALWQAAEVELEALSNNALVVVLEVLT